MKKNEVSCKKKQKPFSHKEEGLLFFKSIIKYKFRVMSEKFKEIS